MLILKPLPILILEEQLQKTHAEKTLVINMGYITPDKAFLSTKKQLIFFLFLHENIV